MTEKIIKTHAMPIALSISGKTSDTIRLVADSTKVVNPVAAPRALDGKSSGMSTQTTGPHVAW